MDFKYEFLTGKLLDYQVVVTGFWGTGVRLLYELYDEAGNVIVKDWTYFTYETYGYEPEFEEDCYDEDGEIKLSEEEIADYVDVLFHDAYEFEDIINGVRRVLSYDGWRKIWVVECHVDGGLDSVVEHMFKDRLFLYEELIPDR
mgnify:CR=1 FL=1